MLKTIRTLLAIVSILTLALIFVDVTGYAASHWAWMAKWQLVPALLSLNVVVVAVLAAATLAIGRIYCSVICPLGIYQDVVNRLGNLFASKKKRHLGRFHHAETHTRLRLGFLAAFLVLMSLGLLSLVAMSFASLIDPYSAFGRMMTWMLRPGAVEINNLLADNAAQNGSYAFATVAHLPVSVPVLIVSLITFVVVTVFAFTGGRNYCNMICPVGTILGYLSRYSWLKPTIDTDKCTRCGSCARHCKASCIDARNHTIDYTRCVACFDCLSACKEGAISYRHTSAKSETSHTDDAPDNNVDTRRRAFMMGGVIMASGAVAHAVTSATDGGLAPMKKKQSPKRDTPVVPPGAKSQRWLRQHCVACQLCIANCPSGLLKPSTSADTFMQPVMNFEDGFCRPECTTCSDICPADAILPIDVPTKSSTKIGTAVVDLESCISAAYGQSCGNCSSKCPTGAITMISVDDASQNLRPLVDASACIGCGSCEYHCPVGKTASIKASYPAIHVEGIETHHTI